MAAATISRSDANPATIKADQNQVESAQEIEVAASSSSCSPRQGALGAYQTGAHEGLAEAGIVPNWIAGVSIGAINAALIAGNPPERRVEKMRAFWTACPRFSL
jgi:hypothetical protein